MMRRGERGKEERVAEETGKGCMEWDLKTPSWDLAELEREAMAPLVGSSNFGEHKFKGDCLVDLKLGRLGDFGDGSLDKSKDPRISTMLSSSLSSQSSSSKRARPPGNVTQTASCSVDGCTSDLSNCRDYHRRHKVCEVHSKTPTVMVGGQAQRFCQQCSRFHVLAEFDEAKRSCRKRLDGHNRRRRKPQPESLSVNSGNLLSNHQGFCRSPNPQIFTTTSVVSAAWTGVVKTEEDATICNHHFINRQSPFGGSFSNSYKGAGKQFPFMQSNATTIANQTVQEASFCQPPLNTIALSQSEGGRKMFSNGLNRVMDSDCALSLLSSQSTQTSGVSLNNVVRLESIPMARPLVPGLQYNGLGRYSSGGMEDEQMNSVLVTDTSDADLHCQGVFHMGSDEHSQDMGHQTLPFAWE